MSDLLLRTYNYWVHEQDCGNGCTRCGLRQTANGVVFGEGDPTSKLVLVGEAPGEQEDRFTTPFVGPAGQFLRKEAAKVGVDLGSVDLRLRDSKTRTSIAMATIGASCVVTFGCAYWTNVVACRPPQNRVPMFDEIAACRPRLDAIMAAIRPLAILVLGGTALTPLTGKVGITKSRGIWYESRWTWRGDLFTIPVMPTFHPAGLLGGRLKSVGDLELFRQDIRAAYDLAYPDGWSE